MEAVASPPGPIEGVLHAQTGSLCRTRSATTATIWRAPCGPGPGFSSGPPARAASTAPFEPPQSDTAIPSTPHSERGIPVSRCAFSWAHVPLTRLQEPMSAATPRAPRSRGPSGRSPARPSHRRARPRPCAATPGLTAKCLGHAAFLDAAIPGRLGVQAEPGGRVAFSDAATPGGRRPRVGAAHRGGLRSSRRRGRRRRERSGVHSLDPGRSAAAWTG